LRAEVVVRGNLRWRGRKVPQKKKKVPLSKERAERRGGNGKKEAVADYLILAEIGGAIAEKKKRPLRRRLRAG